MARKKRPARSLVVSDVVLSARDYVDDRVERSHRDLTARMGGLNDKIDGAIMGLNAKIDGAVVGLNAKIDGAVIGLNAKMDGLSAKFDGLSAKVDGIDAKVEAVLTVVTPLFGAVQQLAKDVAVIKEMLELKKPMGFRREEPA